MSTPSAGDVIEGKYRLERELGSGGMGAVWLATQLMVDRPVAVKLLHPAHADEADLLKRFEVEAKAIGKLNHPNVITLYDFGWSAELEAFYTVIEYIDGVSLDKRLNERMPLREVADIIRQIALALDHAHYHGILHRDLKPENVMLSRMTDGSQMVKVLDFGIARIVKGSYDTESPDSQRITKAGEVFGTPAYMSPEQARSLRRLTPAADLYSLGIMMYELVAGYLPFFAKSAFDLLMLHVTKPVPPIKRDDVPPELTAVIFRLLDKDPERRFQTGGELARTLVALRLPEQSPTLAVDDEGFPTHVDEHLPEFEREAATMPMVSQQSEEVIPTLKGTPPLPLYASHPQSAALHQSQPMHSPPMHSQPMHSQPMHHSQPHHPPLRAATVMLGETTTDTPLSTKDSSTKSTLLVVGILFALLVVLTVVVAIGSGSDPVGPDHETLKQAIQAQDPPPRPAEQPVVPPPPPPLESANIDAGVEPDQ